MLTWNAMALSLALLVLGGCSNTHQPVGTQSAEGHAGAQSIAGNRSARAEPCEIPDGDPGGILLGPLVTDDDGRDLGSLLLRLEIQHPCTGDLDIWLVYDGDGDGHPEVRAPIEFYRSRPDVMAEELYACPPSLRGTYFFRDDPSAPDAVFEPFRALPRGRAFYLAVADTLAEVTGSVLGWSVSLDEPVTAAR